ncbi:hypothetical protein BACCIP111883_02625 [Sutcliffiella rhizosphaerae]|uniref:Transposase IS4-like domain-containing protein n=1 Tax=Sutcliffiella rhizosphaerae TaxID=2880967 RepID=A0ABM8YPD5_9BACI|nr:hypothetical protein BACCIP111883_02625 [Sutcliffiella rhizosphaerae]
MKDEREKQFAYSFHTACDSTGFILATQVTGANVHDSRMLESLVNEVQEKVGKPTAVAVVAGYKTAPIAHYLLQEDIRPVMPYTRPRINDGYMKKYEYTYDEHYDCYICPKDHDKSRLKWLLNIFVNSVLVRPLTCSLMNVFCSSVYL